MFAVTDKSLEKCEIILPCIYSALNTRLKRYVREQYIKKQNNKCYYCGCSLDNPPPKEILEKKVTTSLFPKEFFNYPVHLHHNHETDMTIGVVHAYCNAVLWEYENE